jgi:hypothetical protein
MAQWAAEQLSIYQVDDMLFVPAVASRMDLVMYPLIRATMDAFVDSQRRRLTGRGE